MDQWISAFVFLVIHIIVVNIGDGYLCPFCNSRVVMRVLRK